MSQPRPLAGVRAIDYSHFLAGPFIARSLAALGAEVIKVERPPAGDAGRTHPFHVDGQSGYYLQQNMDKQGVCVDAREPRGLEFLYRLIDTADVFVENYRPGALDRLGLGYERLSERNDRLVYCSVSAYGHTGPDADQPGFGLIVEARSGAMAMLGTPGETPPLFGIAVADMYAGMHGVAAVCAALFGRATSGRGQHVDVALLDSMVSIHEYAIQSYMLSGGSEIPAQTGRDLRQSTLYGVFRSHDGDFVLAAQVDDVWKRLALVVGGQDMADDTRYHTLVGRNSHHDAILAIVREWAMAQPSVDACVAALRAARVPCARVQRIDEVIADPQVIARGMLVQQEHPVLGRITMPNLPFRFSGCDTSPRSAAPLLGQHNRAVAEDLGYSSADIDAMVRDGVLYAEDAVTRLEGQHQ